jgi:uncharacterized protein YbcI
VSDLDSTAAREQPRSIEIANLVVAAFREYTGRGPTQARTHFSDDLISVVLRDSLTKGEQQLVNDGKADLVMSMRSAFQNTMSSHLTTGVERITGRNVLAFLSSNHLDPDIAIESFVLAPNTDAAADGGSPGRG